MVNFSYLRLGLCAMARAHRANSMAGHLGAAVVAGYFFGEEHPDLDEGVSKAVEHELDRIMKGEEEIWYGQKAAGITIPDLFAPIAGESVGDARAAADPIAVALSESTDRLRQSGHNVIFASLAIRALRDHPELATAGMIEGIRMLMLSFRKASPGRGYFGKEAGWKSGNEVKLPAADDTPAYDSLQGMAEVIIEQLIRSAGVRRQGFGGLFHLINHAAALLEFERLGYADLASAGIANHRHHLRLWRSLPDVEAELGPLVKAEHPAEDPAYWSREESVQWSGWLTHRIKTLFGFSVVLDRIEDEATVKEARRQFRYLLA